MSSAQKPGSRPDSLEAGLLRIGRQELASAIRAAGAIATDPEESVHLCRKSIKRLRALARLGRESDLAGWQEIDVRLRDAGRRLSTARDASILERRLAELSEPGTVSVSLAAVTADDAIPDVTALLEGLGPLLDGFLAGGEWSLDRLLGALAAGAGESARDRRRFEQRNRAKDAHAWRKGVQRYKNQLRIVATLLPGAVDARISGLDALADCLGEYHDLAVLRRALKSGLVTAGDVSRSDLDKRSKATQAALRKRAFAIDS